MAPSYRTALLVSVAINFVLLGIEAGKFIGPPVRDQRPFGSTNALLTSPAVFADLPPATRERLNRELQDDREAISETLAEARTTRKHALDLATAEPYSEDAVAAALADARRAYDRLMEEAHASFITSLKGLSAEERRNVIAKIRNQVDRSQPIPPTSGKAANGAGKNDASQPPKSATP